MRVSSDVRRETRLVMMKEEGEDEVKQNKEGRRDRAREWGNLNSKGPWRERSLLENPCTDHTMAHALGGATQRLVQASSIRRRCYSV